jgi:transposase
MLQITPQMKILVAVEPADFRRGIDALARLCQETLRHDPFVGTVFVFRNRKATAVKVLMYDGQGFWLCQNKQGSDCTHLPAFTGISRAGNNLGDRPDSARGMD